MTSSDDEDPACASVLRSQLRRRYDLGGDSSGESRETSINQRETARPSAPSATDDHSRATILPARPRLALGAIPRRLVDETEMLALPLDQRSAFVLMHVDGKTPLRTLVDVTGMMTEEVVALVERLIELKAVNIL